MIRAAVAQGWGAATAKACGQSFPDCARCRRPGSEEIRKTWGCDHDSLRQVWESTCPRCTGHSPSCGRCGGRGIVAHRRCPSSMVNEATPGLRVHLDLLMRAYSHYDRRNVLPAAGAWLDQARSFLAGVDMIDAERSYWDGLLHDHQEREMERTRRQQQKASPRGRR